MISQYPTQPVGLLTAIALAAILLSSTTASAVPAIDFWTIDNGGGASTGGHLELQGTIAQADTDTPATGNRYVLTGGFWFQQPPGDCNADGIADLFDHDDFVPCLDGPGTPITDHACRCFDFDRDGNIDLSDFSHLTQVMTP